MTVINGEESPVYLKLRGMISAMILDGDYAEGDQLPSVRAFAAEHGANPLTVAKAYQSLQERGFVSVKRGVGMFVADGATDKLRAEERDVFLNVYWPKLQEHIVRLGLNAADLLEREEA